MTINAIRYDTPEALWEALGAIMGVEESQCQELIAGTKACGTGSWIDEAGSIHFWACNQEDTGVLVALFALEITGGSGLTYMMSEADRTAVCNQIAAIAMRAHQLAMEFRDGSCRMAAVSDPSQRLH